MNKALKQLKNSRKMKISVAVLLCIIAAAVCLMPSEASKSVRVTNEEEDYTETLENVLASIKGVGSVRVMITYVSGSETICASTNEKQTNTVIKKNENGNTKQSETVIENSKPVTVGSGNDEDALVIVEKEPEIKGVIVVAEGADDVNVKLALQRAVQTVLQVKAEKVEIFTMK